jgi:hypothetical protein
MDRPPRVNEKLPVEPAILEVMQIAVTARI